MEVITTGEKVRAGKSHKRKPCSVRTASYWLDFRCYADFLHRFFCKFYNTHIVFYYFSHIIVLVIDFDRRNISITLVKKLYFIGNKFFSVFEGVFIKISYYIIKNRFGNISFHIGKVEKAFIAFGCRRSFVFRKH